MPVWRIFTIAFLGLLCLAMASATIVVPMSESAGDNRWLWLVGLLLGTGVTGVLLTLFLKNSDKALNMK